MEIRGSGYQEAEYQEIRLSGFVALLVADLLITRFPLPDLPAAGRSPDVLIPFPVGPPKMAVEKGSF